jgi:hypothetical protein
MLRDGDRSFDEDLVPWSARPQDMLSVTAGSNSLYNYSVKKKENDIRKVPPKNIVNVESEEIVLCKVLRTDLHSSETKHMFSNTSNSSLPIAPRSNEVDSMVDCGPKKTQIVTMLPSEFKKYFSQFEERKPPLPKPKTIPLEYIPRIPFSSPDQIREPSRNNDTNHPRLLHRTSNSSRVTIIPPTSNSILEWRKQRNTAEMSIKQLKKIFPSITLIHKKRKGDFLHHISASLGNRERIGDERTNTPVSSPVKIIN